VRPKAGTGVFGSIDGVPSFLQAEVLKPFITEELLQSTTPKRLRSGAEQVIATLRDADPTVP